MRCKVGDLAIVVRSEFPGHVGKLVNVVSFWGDGRWVVEALFEVKTVRSYRTGLEKPRNPKQPLLCRDDWLRPLRDSDGADETLAWAGRPEKVEA